MPGYEHALDPAHTVTGHSLEQRLEQARDLVRRVFRVSRLLSSSATKRVFGPYRSKNCDSTSRHAASSMAAQAVTPTTSQHRAGARIGTLIPLRLLAVVARSSTLQPCSQSTSSTESALDSPGRKPAGEQGLDLDHARFASSRASHALASSIGKVMAGNVATFFDSSISKR